MDSIEVLGGIKIEPNVIKLEKPDENQDKVVEIAADDIESDEESGKDCENGAVVEIGIEDVIADEQLKKINSCIKKEKGNSDLSETETTTLILNDAYENSSYESSNEEDNNNELKFDCKDLNTKESQPNPKSVDNEEKPKVKKKKRIRKYISKSTITVAERMENKMSTPSRHTAEYEYSHQEGDNYKCSYCNEVVEGHREVKLHIIKKHRKVKLNKCPHCPFESVYDLGKHILYMHTDEKDIKYFRCDQCDFKGKTKGSLRRHVFSHMSLGQLMGRLYKCEQCPKVKKECFERHVRIVHKEEMIETLKCPQCEYQCVRRGSMNRHMETRHVEPETLETLKCSQCSYKTKYPIRLKSHLGVKHSALNFQCHICPYQAKKKTVLQLHLIGHKKEKADADLKYRCDKCDYKTHRDYNLRVHKLNHLKPEEIEYFYCYHCDFKAKRKDNLKSHIFRHSKKEELTLACYICDFTTKKRDKLVRHIDKHSKEFKEENRKKDANLKKDSDEIKHSKDLKEEKKIEDTKLKKDSDKIKHSKDLKGEKKIEDTKLKKDSDEIKQPKKLKEERKKIDTKLKEDNGEIKLSKKLKEEKQRKSKRLNKGKNKT